MWAVSSKYVSFAITRGIIILRVECVEDVSHMRMLMIISVMKGMCRRRKPHENADDYMRNENIVEPPTWETTASEDSWDYDDVEPY